MIIIVPTLSFSKLRLPCETGVSSKCHRRVLVNNKVQRRRKPHRHELVSYSFLCEALALRLVLNTDFCETFIVLLHSGVEMGMGG